MTPLSNSATGHNRMRLGAQGPGAVAPWSPDLLKVPGTVRTDGIKYMPREKIVAKVKAAQARAGLPPIAPPQDLGQGASQAGLGAWWSPVELARSALDTAKHSYRALSELYARRGQSGETRAQGEPPAELQPGSAPAFTEASCPVGAPEGACDSQFGTVAGLKDLVARVGDGWTLTLSPSLAQRPDQSLRGVTVALTDRQHRKPEVQAQLAQLRQGLDGKNTVFLMEDPKDCAPLSSACGPIEVGEASDRLDQADAQALQASMRFFHLMCEHDPALRRRLRSGATAEDVMAVALEALTPTLLQSLSSEQQDHLIAVLTQTNQVLQQFIDSLHDTRLPRSEFMFERVEQAEREHPDATRVMDCGWGHYEDKQPQYMQKDFILIERPRD